MRLQWIVLCAALASAPLRSHAAEFSIASGDLHAAATVTGTPPTKDNPPDVALGASLSQGSVAANAKGTGPDGAVGSFTSGGGVSLNSASFSFTGHSTGDGGVVGHPVGTGSGSIDLIFTLDAPAQIQFVGNEGLGSTLTFTSTGSLSSNGSVIAPLTFDGSGNLDFVQSLNAGSYELQASSSISPAGELGGNGSESVTATIVPEPMAALAGFAATGALTLFRRSRQSNKGSGLSSGQCRRAGRLAMR